MNIVYQKKRWDITYPLLFTIFRVILGLCLAIRGIYFLNNMLPLQQIIEGAKLNTLNLNMALALLIMGVHILGGTFIVLGLKTRIAVWAQIPIVLGAIIFINIRNALLFTSYTDLLFSIFILLLLVLFAFEGGGKISMDCHLRNHLL